MIKTLPLALVCLLLASCEGSDNAGPSKVEDKAFNEMLGVKADGEGYFLRTLRNPCDVLTAERATEILGAEATSNGGRASFLMASCAYIAPGNKNLNINIMMHGSHLLDSSMMSEEQMLTQFKYVYEDDAERMPTDVGFGKGAFFAHTQDGTQLAVATGISGTAMTSDRATGEAAMYLFLKNSGMDPSARLDALKSVAKSEFQAMDEIARKTHE